MDAGAARQPRGRTAESGWVEAHSFDIDTYTTRTLQLEAGRAVAPDEPGSGVVFDWERLEPTQYRSISEHQQCRAAAFIEKRFRGRCLKTQARAFCSISRLQNSRQEARYAAWYLAGQVAKRSNVS